MLSMTGYGKASGKCANDPLEIQITSVNRKQLDIALMLPPHWASAEAALRDIISQHCRRGRIQVSLNFSQRPLARRLHTQQAKQAHDALSALAKSLGLREGPTLRDILNYPGVLDSSVAPTDLAPVPTAPVLADTKKILIAALEHWNKQRAAEGKKLLRDITARLKHITAIVTQLEAAAPRIAERAQAAAKRKLDQLARTLSQPQINDTVRQEILSGLLRGDFTEELTRLKAHIEAFNEHIRDSEARHLEFLAQEFLREINTVASKCNDSAAAQLTVQAKAEIEKIREQLANIE